MSISRILGFITEGFIETAAAQTLTSTKACSGLSQWGKDHIQSAESIETRKMVAAPGDGDVIQLDISKEPRLSAEQVSKMLRGDTAVKWKE